MQSYYLFATDKLDARPKLKCALNIGYVILETCDRKVIYGL